MKILIKSSEENKKRKYTCTYRISQVWYEDGQEVDRDTWEETRTATTTNPLLAQSKIENRLEREYGDKRGEHELELELLSCK